MSPAANVPSVELCPGVSIPVLGLGTWKGKDDEMALVVKDAVDLGYRHIDTAWVYENEKGVGAGIAAKIADGTVKRDDLFVVTKLWNKFHAPENVEKMARESLKNLGLDYVDLYLIHWPVAFTPDTEAIVPRDDNNEIIFTNDDYVETYKAMEKLVELGLVKAIGLSNFNSKQIQRILDVCSIKPVVNQVECHPWLNQQKLIDFCKGKGIHVTAYSPLGSPDRPWAQGDEPSLLDDPRIKAIGEKYGKSNAQVLIKYQIARGLSVIPKSVSRERMARTWTCLTLS
jgi:aldehyde reductase